MSAPRILFVSSRAHAGGTVVPPHGSGAHIASSLGALSLLGEVLVVSPPDDGAEAWAPAALRRVVPAVARGARRDVRTWRAGRALAAASLAQARAFAPTVVYERNEWFADTGLRLARALDVPLVLEVNGLLAEELALLYRSGARPAGALLERRKARSAAAVVVESTGMTDAVAASFGPLRRVAVVPNSVADDRVRAEPRRHDPSRSVVVGWIGHLMPWHVDALRFLIDAAARIPDARFAVIGGGPGLDTLAQRARDAGVADRFEFSGPVPYDDVPAALERVDVGVVPDVPPHKLPVKAVEFLAAGIPVVAPRSASLDGALVPGEEYLPFDRLDADSFVGALGAAVGDPSVRDRIGAAALRAARERFTWSAVSAALAPLLDEVSRSRR